MKRDYSRIYGKSMRIEKNWREVLDNSAFEISKNGIKDIMET